jgi:hypothetical protein
LAIQSFSEFINFSFDTDGHTAASGGNMEIRDRDPAKLLQQPRAEVNLSSAAQRRLWSATGPGERQLPKRWLRMVLILQFTWVHNDRQDPQRPCVMYVFSKLKKASRREEAIVDMLG